MPPEFSSVEALIESAERRRLCTRIGCTTCGASEFRMMTYKFLAEEIGEGMPEGTRPSEYKMPIEAGSRLLHHLKRLPDDFFVRGYRDGGRAWQFDRRSAIQFLLEEAWQALGREQCEGQMVLVLHGSLAGGVLAAMLVHEQERRRRQAVHAEANDPEAVAARRKAKAEAKAQALAERLRQKAERDEAWRKKNDFRGDV